MASNTSVSPFAVPVSGLWDGDDGAWSSFYVDVGAPPQRLRLLPSLSDAALQLNVNEHQECSTATSPDCDPLFDENKSISWQNTNASFTFLQGNGSTGSSHGGFDTVGLVSPASYDTVLPSQPAVLYPLNASTAGFFGLSPLPHNFSFFATNNTLITALKASNFIPSLSYGLSVGAKYRDNATASLTLGGYDASKFIAVPNASFKLDSTNDEFQVYLQAIVFNNAANRSLLNEPISVTIDSTSPKFWLPPDSCRLFEKAFGLVYDSSAAAYPVNESLHEKLQSENASISFLLSPDANTEVTVNITLPYASFDLEVSPPVVPTSQRYFPLGQMSEPTQYLLGRAFLQEVYLIADFERFNFSVYQRSWNTSAKPQLVTVEAIQSPTRPLPTTSTSNGNLAGITIGVISFFILGIGLAFEFLRGRRASKTSHFEEAGGNSKHTNLWHINPEMDGSGRVHGEVEGTNILPVEVDGTSRAEMQDQEEGGPRMLARYLSELEGNKGGAELEATAGVIEEAHENEGDTRDD